MDIQRTSIHQVYIINPDEIPLPKLVHPAGMQILLKLFGFNQMSLSENAQGTPIVTYQFGTMHQDTREIPITRLAVEDRRILLDVEDATIFANAVYLKLVEELKILSGSVAMDYLSPKVKAQESEIVAHLNFPAERLISSQLSEFINKTLQPMTTSDTATSAINFGQLVFMVHFKLLNPTLEKSSITLNPKEFIIAPRPGIPIEEQIYISKAPVDTESHKELLKSLEITLHQERA
jgi:hypothetical protein